MTDGTMVATSQAFPSINSPSGNVAKNDDGSVDVYFGPTKPDDVADTNWIQTIKGCDFMTVIRLYGTEITIFDQTWKPEEIVKMK